ncbi:MAG TPA: ribose 5-phosphate isomerase B [Polyangiales bacterium]|nr:ribose 5-phosphate isomerase B [Polyangiales bacterium]
MSDTATKRIALGADHAGYALKEALKKSLQGWGIAFEDLGTFDETSTDYPDYAHKVANGVAAGQYSLGVLVCGTGLGMCISANKHKGVRASTCTDAYAARMTRLHNDANVLCLGSRIIGQGVAEDILKTFLDTSFEGGRHAARVAKIEQP